MKFTALPLLVLIVALVACGAPQQAQTPQPQAPEAGRPAPDTQLAPLLTADEPIPGQYVVVLNDDAGTNLSAQSAGGLISALNLDPAGVSVKHLYASALHGFAAQLSAQNLNILRADPRVKYIQQDGVARITATQSNAPWGIDRIDQLNLPLSTTYTYDPAGGSNVTAYVIDTGIRTTHQDFGGRASMGTNLTGDGQNTDCHFHGTMVSSVLGGNTYGVAKGVKLVGVKVMKCDGTGDWSNIIAGVNWVANRTGPRVANMSISGGAYQALDDAVNNAVAKGVVMVVASGNDNKDACQNSPARARNAITVNATGSNDARWNYSNYGSCTDLFAPGANITAATKTSDTATSTQSGTSLASPHVAGAAALILGSNTSLTPAQVESKLIADSTTGKVTSAGTGSPNRLLYVTATGTTPPPPVNTAPVANFTSTVSGLSVNFTSTSTDAENNISTYAWNFGDGTTSTAANPSKTYTAAGTYTVTLTVTDSGGLSSTSTKSVTVSSPGGGTPGPETYTGSLSSGSYAFQPGSTGIAYTAGTITATLTGPTTADFDLYLQKRNTDGTWAYVVKQATSATTERVTYTATAGTYRWIVSSYTGSGSYTLTVNR